VIVKLQKYFILHDYFDFIKPEISIIGVYVVNIFYFSGLYHQYIIN